MRQHANAAADVAKKLPDQQSKVDDLEKEINETEAQRDAALANPELQDKYNTGQRTADVHSRTIERLERQLKMAEGTLRDLQRQLLEHSAMVVTLSMQLPFSPPDVNIAGVAPQGPLPPEAVEHRRRAYSALREAAEEGRKGLMEIVFTISCRRSDYCSLRAEDSVCGLQITPSASATYVS